MSKPDGRKTKRHHHTVPRFYLRRFAAPDSRLLRVPIDGSAARLVGVGDAAVHKDFYSFRGPDGSLDDVVENQLSVVEDAAAPVLRRVVDERRWPLFGDDREIMALWVALQYLRVPAHRKAGNEVTDHLVKTTMAMGGKPGLRSRMEELAKGPVADDEVERAWAEVSDFSNYEVRSDNAEHLSLMGMMIPEIALLLMSRTWVLVRFSRKTLITSDHPVVQIWDPSVPDWIGQGMATVPAVCLPLDRRVALLMLLPGGAPDRETTPTVAMARDLNQRVAASARGAVFHHPEDDLEGIVLPEPRLREMRISGGPAGFLLPDGPSEEFKATMSEAPEPPATARAPRRGPGSTR
ncbi:DUF4238 domain-containing protein [Streptomyces sp. NBC_00654]|uniref:DUF4238 domain-containing protein n=1 Tax=Streptomyces sp. NBC_00654 TaxID=2975799 RepID=UPI00224CC757|nr:DUF4238 domain-containing protein [Streptomyces sp. NBC_00654]MCX4965798.1 DUF4238 domain-containing protein [Streptomyces sp. NBC_00654]